MEKLDGCSSATLLEKVLQAIDDGASTSQIRADPLKWILSGKTKEIIVNTGGEGLIVCRDIVEEMARRGDEWATTTIQDNKFHILQKQEYAYLESRALAYNRTNPILISMLKENPEIGDNIGGWTLEIFTVPEEDWAYQIRNATDMFRSEYVVGAID